VLPGQPVRRGGDGAGRVALRQALGRDDEAVGFQRLLDGDDRRQLEHLHLRLGRGLARVEHLARHHHRHRLADELHRAVGQEGVVVDDGAAVVLARDVARGEHRHHAVHGQDARRGRCLRPPVRHGPPAR
jgi:hypothetical protein